MNERAAGVLRFNNCVLDLDRRELRRDGTAVPLEPRVFALLKFLIEQRHRAVSKDEIQDQVWPGTIVSETALTRAIMKCRRAVGDSADAQAVIRTVHGHGYQFVAALKAATPDAEPPASRLLPRAFAAAFAIVLLGFIAYLWSGTPPDTGVHIAVMPVDNRTGDSDYDWTRLGLMGFAGDLLAQGNTLTVMRASDAIRYAEVNGQPIDESAAANLAELGDVYGASHLLLTRLEKNAGVLRLSYALHAEDGLVERGTMVGADPTSLVRGLAQTIVQELAPRSGTVTEMHVIGEDPFINEAYSRGMALALEGRCADALQLFEVVRSASQAVNHAHYEWANCARILGRWQEAEAAFSELIEVLPHEPPSPLLALAHHGLGTVFIRTGRGAEAEQILNSGLEIAQRAGDRIAEGMLLNNLAIAAKDRREHDEARSLLMRATVAYTEAKRGMLPGQLPAALANIDMAEGKLDLAEQHLLQALEAFRATGDRRNEAMMLNNFGYLRRLQGRIDEAEPLHLESLAIRRDIGDRVGQGRILGMLSILYENEGRFDDARAAANEAFQIASEANDRLFMATSLAQLAQAEFSDGELERAREAYRDSMALFEEINDASRAAQVTVRLARIDVHTGNLAAAEQRVSTLLAQPGTEHEPAIEALELQGDIQVLHADDNAAIASYQAALRRIDESGFVVNRQRVTVKLAKLLLDQNDLAAAEPLIGYLIEAGESPDTLRVRARFAAGKDDADGAIELLDTLRQQFGDDWTDRDQQVLETLHNKR
jgi:DNA-binding winged helix-turn-helix (wHTH) protein/tetratricopeptide (TPR) repeat protein